MCSKWVAAIIGFKWGQSRGDECKRNAKQRNVGSKQRRMIPPMSVFVAAICSLALSFRCFVCCCGAAADDAAADEAAGVVAWGPGAGEQEGKMPCPESKVKGGRHVWPLQGNRKPSPAPKLLF
eukprot:9581301-Alexandrium_andersonii.AAC.2